MTWASQAANAPTTITSIAWAMCLMSAAASHDEHDEEHDEDDDEQGAASEQGVSKHQRLASFGTFDAAMEPNRIVPTPLTVNNHAG